LAFQTRTESTAPIICKNVYAIGIYIKLVLADGRVVLLCLSSKNIIKSCELLWVEHINKGPSIKDVRTKSQKIDPLSSTKYPHWFRYAFICQDTSTRRQQRDFFGHRVKLPPVTTSLNTQRLRQFR